MDSQASTHLPHPHDFMYLSHVHQGDGLEYSRCNICGWIKFGDMQSKIAEIAKAAEGLAKALVPFAEATEVSNPRRDLDQRKPWLFGSGTPITLGDVFRLHDALIGWQEANK